MSFNHNEIGQPNGNYFALPYSPEETDLDLSIISVPWDVTTSYKPGTSEGPSAIIEASSQIDLFDFDIPEAWKIKIASQNLDILELNFQNRKLAEKVIKHLEKGGSIEDKEIKEDLDLINKASSLVNNMIYDATSQIIQRGIIPCVVGGEHSVSFGIIKAVSEANPGVGILHIDAHADLREAYEGFKYSHASVMYNVLNQLENISTIVQVGIRDLCEDEFNLIKSSNKITMFSDNYLKESEYNGINWAVQCENIIGNLPEKVYISFDIDGLSPSFCPNTGTPVPGGLDFTQAVQLIKHIVKSNRKIVGFDLNEVAPSEDSEWDAIVGARLLFKLCCFANATK